MSDEKNLWAKIEPLGSIRKVWTFEPWSKDQEQQLGELQKYVPEQELSALRQQLAEKEKQLADCLADIEALSNHALVRRNKDLQQQLAASELSRADILKKLEPVRDLVFKALCVCKHQDAPVSALCHRCKALATLKELVPAVPSDKTEA